MAELQVVFWFCGIYSAVVLTSFWFVLTDQPAQQPQRQNVSRNGSPFV